MKQINTDFSLADSSYKSCEFKNENLKITIESWDNKIIEITFLDVIKFTYRLDSIISSIYQKMEETDFFREALKLCYAEIPKEHSYKEFLIVDIDDTAIFQVVAENIQLKKHDNN